MRFAPLPPDGTSPGAGPLLGTPLTTSLYAVTQLPAPQPPLSSLQLRLLHHTHRLLQDLAHLLRAKPLLQAAAHLAQAVKTLPDVPSLRPHLDHLAILVEAAADALQAPQQLPTYVDDLIDIYCEAEQTFTVL